MPTHLIAAMSLLVMGQSVPAGPPQVAGPSLSKSLPESQAEAPPVETEPDMGLWLVNLARHQGHLVGRTDPRRASLHVLALLRAAVTASPDCAEAHYWLYDLEQRMGREAEARRALAKYVQLRPEDDSARLRLFDLELQDFQTAEARVAVVKAQLARKPLSPVVASALHYQLARHHFQRQEIPPATGEVETALRLNPMNVAARDLAYQMFRETEPALQRVETALQLISINPTQANLVWDLAALLDRLSLHEQAQQWYRRAIALHRRANAGAVPAEFQYKLAVSYADAGDFDLAKKAVDAALRIDPSLLTARLLRARILTGLGQAEAAAADLDAAAKSYGSMIDGVFKEKDHDTAAEIAWFYCYHRPDPERALKLATLAVSEPQPSLPAKVAYGYALQLNGRTKEAIKTLQPLADIDQFAAYELAVARIGQGKRGEAVATLKKAAAIQSSGIAHDLISGLLAENGEKPPRPPSRDKVLAALKKFQPDVFDYPRRPEDFLHVEMRFETDRLSPTGPVNVVFRLENIGPFPITFGEGFMAMPLVALSARIGGESAATYENYLQVLMNARPTLLPGDVVEKAVAIDVGPVREHLRRTVAHAVPIEITAMFDPVYGKSGLTAGLGTISVEPIQTVRTALDVSPEGMTRLLREARAAAAGGRVRVAEQIGAILAAAQSGLPDAMCNALPMNALREALAGLVADRNWQVRAHAVVAAGWSPLSKDLTVAAAACVRDAQPVVKVLAVRLFAEQHGEKFKGVLEQLGKSDPSPFVRMMAASYLPPTTQARAGANAEP